MPAEKAPDWLILVILLLSVVGIPAAIVCIVTCIMAAARAEPDKSNEHDVA